MRRAAALAGALAAASAAPPHVLAGARRSIDLALRRLPVSAPRSLAMRGPIPAAVAPTPTAGAPRPSAASPDVAARPAAAADRSRELITPGSRPTLEEQVIFRASVGFGMDGGEPSGEMAPSAGTLQDSEYAKLRPYGFGDVVLGTRGLLIQSLATYFASEFRLDQTRELAGTMASNRNFTGAVPSVYYGDRDPAKIIWRTGYAEADGVFEQRWLHPLYLRAGRQFKYGVAVAHFDGVALGYDTRPLSLAIWGGARVSLYGLDEALARPAPTIRGGDARLDLFELRRIPIVLSAGFLDFEQVQHREYGIAFRWNPDVLIRASARRLGEHFARESLAIWARLSEVTTVNVQLDNRTEYDWMYDLMALRPVDRRGDPRSYLDLGAPLPRVQLDARAGTVLLHNLDILFRAAAAAEHADGDVTSPFSPSYLEAAAAIDVRLRRNLKVGSSVTARRYRRDDLIPIQDVPASPDPLPDPANQIGELSFYEGGLGVDYSAGARRFNATGELYARAYDRQTPYEQVLVDGFDVHSGGRFAVEGWAQSRLRIRAEYDVSLGPLETAPELRGVKMLRVLTEGTF